MEKNPKFLSLNSDRLEGNKYLMPGPAKFLLYSLLLPNAEMLLINSKVLQQCSRAEHVPMSPDEIENEDPSVSLWQEMNDISNINARVNRILKFREPYFESQSKISEQKINFKDPALNPTKSIADLNIQTERNTQLNYKKHIGYPAEV